MDFNLISILNCEKSTSHHMCIELYDFGWHSTAFWQIIFSLRFKVLMRERDRWSLPISMITNNFQTVCMPGTEFIILNCVAEKKSAHANDLQSNNFIRINAHGKRIFLYDLLCGWPCNLWNRKRNSFKYRFLLSGCVIEMLCSLFVFFFSPFSLRSCSCFCSCTTLFSIFPVHMFVCSALHTLEKLLELCLHCCVLGQRNIEPSNP